MTWQESSAIYDIRNQNVDEQTIIEKYLRGEYEFHPQMYTECLPKPWGNNRRKLFEYFIQTGFPLYYETDDSIQKRVILWSAMNFIAQAGMDWLKYACENYPKQLNSCDFGSAVCNVASDHTLEQFQYLTEQTKADTCWWAPAIICCFHGFPKALEYCMLNNYPIRRDYCMEGITKYHPELLENELIQKYFIDHDDMNGKIQTIYLMDKPNN